MKQAQKDLLHTLYGRGELVIVQIVPAELNLTLIYSPGRQSVLVVSSDFWSVMGAW